MKTPLDTLLQSYPNSRLHQTLPLKIFGCISFVHYTAPGRSKLELRAIKCVFLGYPLNMGISVLILFRVSFLSPWMSHFLKKKKIVLSHHHSSGGEYKCRLLPGNIITSIAK